MGRCVGFKVSEKTKKKMSELKKGVKLSKEHIENIRKSHIGQKAWNKGRKFPQYFGENHPNWKPKIKKICLVCNKGFEVPPSWSKRKLCSKECFKKEMKGRKSWSKGKKLHYPVWNKGKKGVMPIPWNKDKKLIKTSGKNHWNWKGGTTPLYESIRKLFENKQWKKKVFARDDFTCQECFLRSGKIEVHHKNSFSNIFNEFLKEYSQFSPIEDRETLLRLAITYKPFWDLENGKTLCEDCHKETDNYFRRCKNGPSRWIISGDE